MTEQSREERNVCHARRETHQLRRPQYTAVNLRCGGETPLANIAIHDHLINNKPKSM